MIYTDALLKVANDPRIHWVQLAEDGVIEFYLDNHMLQTFRACEARGILDFVEGYQGSGRVWFLDFGTVVHDLMELYYCHRYDTAFDIHLFCLNDISRVWNERKMDYYLTLDMKHPWRKKFNDLGGLIGLMSLMSQYTALFRGDNERFRVVGAELYFGRDKSVPIYDFKGTSTEELAYRLWEVYSRDAVTNWYEAEKILREQIFPFRIYLCGKIDLLIDDGYSIGPMDHKTASNFMGKDPLLGYEVHDGMTGYVYAARHLIKNLNIERRPVKNIWMNMIQVKPTDDPKDRFKRLPLFKTDEQLEMYRKRQIATVKRIFDLLSYPELEPFYNTFICQDYMHSECSYFCVHRQNSKANQQKILDTMFTKRDKIWNPSEVQ